MELPNKTFLVNYNAKNYDPSTHTIAKHPNQSFQEDMVLNAAPSAYSSDHITVYGQFFEYTFANIASNPFNRTGTQALTIIAKTSKGFDNSGEHTIVCSRYSGSINWLLFNPANGADNSKVFLHDNSHRYYYNTPCASITTEPNIYAIRINNGSGYGISYTDNTTGSTMTVGYGNGSTRVGFFTDSYRTGGFEIWKGDFYWIYISGEALTDEEIQEVINFNEEQSSQFEISSDNLSFDYSGETESLTITSSNPWTASTSGNWFTISSYSGASGTTITITASSNTGFTEKIGSVTVTDGSKSYTCILSQPCNNNVPFRKMWINGNRIN